jgi:hypothetical protein
MQTQFNLSNLLQAMNNLLQSWYLRLALYGLLLVVVIILAYVLILHPFSSAPLAGPCDPICATPA